MPGSDLDWEEKEKFGFPTFWIVKNRDLANTKQRHCYMEVGNSVSSENKWGKCTTMIKKKKLPPVPTQLGLISKEELPGRKTSWCRANRRENESGKKSRPFTWPGRHHASSLPRASTVLGSFRNSVKELGFLISQSSPPTRRRREFRPNG